MYSETKHKYKKTKHPSIVSTVGSKIGENYCKQKQVKWRVYLVLGRAGSRSLQLL